MMSNRIRIAAAAAASATATTTSTTTTTTSRRRVCSAVIINSATTRTTNKKKNRGIIASSRRANDVAVAAVVAAPPRFESCCGPPSVVSVVSSCKQDARPVAPSATRRPRPHSCLEEENGIDIRRSYIPPRLLVRDGCRRGYETSALLGGGGGIVGSCWWYPTNTMTMTTSSPPQEQKQQQQQQQRRFKSGGGGGGGGGSSLSRKAAQSLAKAKNQRSQQQQQHRHPNNNSSSVKPSTKTSSSSTFLKKEEEEEEEAKEESTREACASSVIDPIGQEESRFVFEEQEEATRTTTTISASSQDDVVTVGASSTKTTKEKDQHEDEEEATTSSAWKDLSAEEEEANEQEQAQQQQHQRSTTTKPAAAVSGLHLHEFAPRIVVVGVGGAGGNAVNNMIATGSMTGVDFLAINTDAQHLSTTLTDNKLQIGSQLTGGLGCGANPDAGRLAAEESSSYILEHVIDAHMVFITAGMGGGTGTGAAPVIAELCYQEGILTVGVVTKPFAFEGTHRMRLANEGLTRLKSVVDTLLIIPNQNLFHLVDAKTSFVDSFKLADDVLLAGVRGITDLMTSPGLINLDFADVQSVMHGMGNAMLGTGQATGEDRAIIAAEQALQNPLLGDLDISTAKGMLVNITGGNDMTLWEVDRAAQRITSVVHDENANIIFGSAFDPTLNGSMKVSVVATGIDEFVDDDDDDNNGHHGSSNVGDPAGGGNGGGRRMEEESSSRRYGSGSSGSGGGGTGGGGVNTSGGGRRY